MVNRAWPSRSGSGPQAAPQRPEPREDRHLDIPSFGWSVIARADADSVLDPARSIIRFFWAMFALGALVNVVLYVFARWIAAPLRRLVSYAGSLEKSEVSAAPSEETRYADAARLGAALAGCCRVLAGSRGRIRQEAGAASSRSAS